jgi:N-acetylglucosamine kinase-like BadF-type ATPase
MSTDFIGVDAGGTQTRALLATADGEVLGRGRGEGANAWSSGGSAAGAISHAIESALAGHAPARVAGGCIAVAGGISSVPERAAEVEEGWSGLGLPGSPRIVIDIVAAYASGTTLPRGLVLTAGTGAIAAFVQDGDLLRRSGGRGWLVGDEGSAVWLGIEGVRAALLALDGRGPRTSLTEAVTSALAVPTDAGVDAATRITDAVYGQPPARLGRLAPRVVAAAEAGDAVALDLVETAAGQLTEIALTAAGEEHPEVIVLGGSVLNRARPIGERVRTNLLARWPDATLERSASGEAGAVALALREAGSAVTPEVLERLGREAGEAV